MSDVPPPQPQRCLNDFPGCRDETMPIGTCLGSLCRHPIDEDGNPNCGTGQCPGSNPPPDEG